MKYRVLFSGRYGQYYTEWLTQDDTENFVKDLRETSFGLVEVTDEDDKVVVYG